jgi:hypothetical protein
MVWRASLSQELALRAIRRGRDWVNLESMVFLIEANVKDLFGVVFVISI